MVHFKFVKAKTLKAGDSILWAGKVRTIEEIEIDDRFLEVNVTFEGGGDAVGFQFYRELKRKVV